RLAVQRRRAEDVGPAEPASDLTVVETAQPLDPWVVTPSLLQDLGFGPVATDPHPYVGRQQGEGLQKDRQPLPGLVATDEEDGGPGGGPRGGLREPLDLDAVVHQLVVAAQRPACHLPGVLGY